MKFFFHTFAFESTLSLRSGPINPNGILGIPCFREGKVNKVQEWASKKGYSLSDATFYSDSFNDLPLLLKVFNAIVVDGDKKLIEEAQKYGWESISFR